MDIKGRIEGSGKEGEGIWGGEGNKGNCLFIIRRAMELWLIIDKNAAEAAIFSANKKNGKKGEKKMFHYFFDSFSVFMTTDFFF